MIHRLSGSAVLALAFVAAGAGCHRTVAPAAPPPPPTVQVVAVEPQDQPIMGEWVGSLAGNVNAEIRAEVTGYLLRQDYPDGGRVKKGQLLFQIDPRPFEAAYAQAKASYDKAEIDLRRNQTLIRQNAVAQQDYDDAVAAELSASAALKTAALNLGFTRIVSPIDGIAGIATAQIGDLVGPSSGVLTTVSQVDPIRVYFSISEQEYLAFARQGPDRVRRLKLTLVLADGSVYPRAGRFLAADRAVDPNTGTLRIAALVPNPDDLLRPGQFARVRAVESVLHGALEVPQQAVMEIQGSYQLATVTSAGLGRVVPVTMGPRVGDRWVVSAGLHPGDRVVVVGMQDVKDGAPVRARAVDLP